jgi:lipopolysaccharide export system protein LptA
MGRLFLLLFTFLLYPIEVAIALDSDRDHPAILDAQNIEIDFSAGRWIYRGNVTIQQGTLHMAADEIHLFFADEVLQRAIAHGQPAVFRQQLENSGHVIRGQAQTIEINEINNVAIFSGKAKLQQHRDTIMGETIIYHRETEKMTVRGNVVTASKTTRLSISDATENTTNVMSEFSIRPRIVIEPQAGAVAGESTNAPSAPSVLSTATDIDSESTAQPTSNQDADGEERRSSGDSLQFHAARVIDVGTVAYSEPRADAALLGELSGRMPVKVLEIRNDWVRIVIPSGINVWVFASYIVEERNGEARVDGRGVRVRWLPKTNSRIVGILAHGEGVRVLGTQNQWKQISLPPSIGAWVPVSQLKMLENISPAWRRDWQAQTEAPPSIGN